ncbi:MAG: hypothetical protein ACREEM_51950, partial [Blastocatellia bacterium]
HTGLPLRPIYLQEELFCGKRRIKAAAGSVNRGRDERAPKNTKHAKERRRKLRVLCVVCGKNCPQSDCYCDAIFRGPEP